MNFDAARLAKLSGLSVDTETKTLTESVNSETQALNENAGHDDHSSVEHMMNEEGDDVLFELDEDEVYEAAPEDDEVLEEDDAPADNSATTATAAEAALQDLASGMQALAKKEPSEAERIMTGPLDMSSEAVQAVIKNAKNVDESTVLNMDTLRETVIELRDEILTEQAAEKQALAEAPARAAIRKEIQSLLSEMPGDAATNWMYGKKGRPSASDTAAANKSRATALFGLGFETN